MGTGYRRDGEKEFPGSRRNLLRGRRLNRLLRRPPPRTYRGHSAETPYEPRRSTHDRSPRLDAVLAVLGLFAANRGRFRPRRHRLIRRIRRRISSRIRRRESAPEGTHLPRPHHPRPPHQGREAPRPDHREAPPQGKGRVGDLPHQRRHEYPHRRREQERFDDPPQGSSRRRPAPRPPRGRHPDPPPPQEAAVRVRNGSKTPSGRNRGGCQRRRMRPTRIGSPSASFRPSSGVPLHHSGILGTFGPAFSRFLEGIDPIRRAPPIRETFSSLPDHRRLDQR